MNSSDTDHKWFELQLDGIPPIRTKLSHSNKDVGSKLEGRIQKQLRVRKKFFHELMDCTKNLSEYEKQIRSDPYPPFNQFFV